MEKPDYTVVMTTCADLPLAERIAMELVTSHLAACVQVIPGVRSFFRWQGKLEQAGEYLVLIKAVNHNYQDIEQKIRDLHTYELPEILAVPVSAGLDGYLDWMNENCKP